MKFWTRRGAADTFDDVLARCLAQIEAGDATVESCVSAHPRHADRLEPSLGAALAVRKTLAVRPDPAFVQRARARMLAAASAPHPALAAAPRPAPRPFLPLWQRPMLAGAAAAVLLLATSSGLVWSSQDAIPGDWNYPIKLKAEAFERTIKLKGNDPDFELALAERRADEYSQILLRNRTEDLTEAQQAYLEQLNKAAKPLYTDPSLPLVKVQQIENSLDKQKETIQSAAEKAQVKAVQAATTQPPTTQPSAAQPSSAPGTASAAATAAPSQSPATTAGTTTPVLPPAVIADVPPVTRSVQAVLNAVTDKREAAAAAAARSTDFVSAQHPATPAASPTAGSSTSTATSTATPTETGRPTASATPSATVSASGTPATGTAAVTAATPGTPEPNERTRVPSTASASPTPAPTAAPSRPTSTVVIPTPTPAPTLDLRPQPLTPTPAAMPQPTATPAPARAPSPSPTPSPTPTRTATPTTYVVLNPGQNTFKWWGPRMPISEAMGGQLAGKYVWVEWTPPGTDMILRYEPGKTTYQQDILFNSEVTIFMKERVLVPLGNFYSNTNVVTVP